MQLVLMRDIYWVMWIEELYQEVSKRLIYSSPLNQLNLRCYKLDFFERFKYNSREKCLQ